MKPAPFQYHAPKTVDQAVAVLAQVAPADGRVLAGGQSLLPAMNFRVSHPSRLVDIQHVAGLKGISIEGGDIIVKADGKTVNTSSELPRIVTQIKPGTKITLQVWRKGASKDIVVTVAELKEDDAAKPTKRGAPPSKEKAKPNRMGLILSDLNDDQKKELDLKSGVVVEDSSGTSRGDIQPGDVILAVISRGATIEAKSADQVNGLIAKLDKGASVTFLLRRGDQQFFSTIKLGATGE